MALFGHLAILVQVVRVSCGTVTSRPVTSLTVHNAEYCSSEALQVIVAELPPRTTKQSKLAPHTTQLASCTATAATSVLNPKQRR